MFDWLWGAVKTVRGAEVERREAEMVGRESVHDDPFPALVTGEAFTPGICYFGIRLAGLHVVDARQFATKRYPLCVCLAEFKQRGRDRTVPFSVGPQEMLTRLTKAGVFKQDPKPGWIELRDLPVVGPTPVGVGNLSLFAGLYSVPGDDIVKTLLDVVGDLSQNAGLAAPALQTADSALKIAKAVYGGIGTLIGSTTLTPLAQAQFGRVLRETGSGYLVVGNVPSNAIRDQGLVVREGKLFRGAAMVTDFDYCLLAIERHASILEAATQTAPDLFDDGWQEVVKALGGDDPATAAPRALRKLVTAVRGSPELIEADRAAVIAGYLALYNQQRAQDAAIATATKGAGDSLITALSAESARQEERNRDVVARKLSTVLGQLGQVTRGMPILQAASAMRAALREDLGDDGDFADALLRTTQEPAA